MMCRAVACTTNNAALVQSLRSPAKQVSLLFVAPSVVTLPPWSSYLISKFPNTRILVLIQRQEGVDAELNLRKVTVTGLDFWVDRPLTGTKLSAMLLPFYKVDRRSKAVKGQKKM